MGTLDPRAHRKSSPGMSRTSYASGSSWSTLRRSSSPVSPPRLAPSESALAGAEERVRRDVRHAVPEGPDDSTGVHLEMTGRIIVGRRLSFTDEQEFRGQAFA